MCSFVLLTIASEGSCQDPALIDLFPTQVHFHWKHGPHHSSYAIGQYGL